MNQREKLDKLRWRSNQKASNIVFYSYKMSEHDHINEHEFKRLTHSISSLREFNNEISVYLFCDKPNLVPNHFKSKYSVLIRPFVKGFDHHMLSAWSIHRWYNLKHFKGKNYNILYLDSDTIFYCDVQYLFDTYCHLDVYGREEFGFRFDPNTGGGLKIREQLDKVDEAIFDLGGRSEVYKYCLGVVLLNNNFHKYIIDKLDELTDLMELFKKSEILMPIPNPRIVDQYAVWVILSRIEVIGGLFAIQDVTMGYKEQKHKEFFNPIVLHYTTKGEQELAKEERFSNLRRDVDELAADIDPYHVL
jgi:hypothetical protein|tara:strand:- start:2744 stop:3655 length:912 start_codon:yes stop_codon:yes gene_type:complete